MSVEAMETRVATLLLPSGWLACAAFFLFGVGPILWTISSTTQRQTMTPQVMLGWVWAIFLAVNLGPRPLGAALGGLVGERWGAPACLWLALGGYGVQAVLIFRSPVRGWRRLPRVPAAGRVEAPLTQAQKRLAPPGKFSRGNLSFKAEGASARSGSRGERIELSHS